MKYRVKVKVDANNNRRCYPQYKRFLFWHYFITKDYNFDFWIKSFKNCSLAYEFIDTFVYERNAKIVKETFICQYSGRRSKE